MDGTTTSLISSLLEKLAELDDKVSNYRKDLAKEFQRYISDAPEDVKAEVNRVIASGRFPNLYPPGVDPEGHTSNHKPPVIERKHWDGRRSPPPVLHHTSGTPTGTISSPGAGTTVPRTPNSGLMETREPHAREEEFRGFITPTYLPLLDSDPRTPTASPPARSTPEPTPDKDSSGDVECAKSHRKSALRRSSGSKTSLRRVRFVLPSSPVLNEPLSPPEPASTIVDSPAPSNDSSNLDESPGTRSLLYDDDNDPPPPRKISSSQALSALSKLPLEDPSMWTVVNANPEPGAADESATPPEAQSSVANSAPPKSGPSLSPDMDDELFGAPQLGSPLQDLEAYEDESSASDDDFISMPMRPSRVSNPLSPQIRTATTWVTDASMSHHNGQDGDARPGGHTRRKGKGEAGDDVKLPSLKTASKAHDTDAPEADVDGDELFSMEEDAQANTNVQPYLAQEDDLVLDTEIDAPPEKEGIPIEKPPQSPSLAAPQESEPSASTGPLPITAGSYKGRPFSFDVVKDPKLLQKAAALGDVVTFIGSIDGRSGVDSVDPSSYRGASFRGNSSVSAMALSGTPRSLSERVLLEELVQQGKGPPKR